MNHRSLQQLHRVKSSEILLADIPPDIGGRACDGVSNFVCVCLVGPGMVLLVYMCGHINFWVCYKFCSLCWHHSSISGGMLPI